MYACVFVLISMKAHGIFSLSSHTKMLIPGRVLPCSFHKPVFLLNLMQVIQIFVTLCTLHNFTATSILTGNSPSYQVVPLAKFPPQLFRHPEVHGESIFGAPQLYWSGHQIHPGKRDKQRPPVSRRASEAQRIPTSIFCLQKAHPHGALPKFQFKSPYRLQSNRGVH